MGEGGASKGAIVHTGGSAHHDEGGIEPTAGTSVHQPRQRVGAMHWILRTKGGTAGQAHRTDNHRPHREPLTRGKWWPAPFAHKNDIVRAWRPRLSMPPKPAQRWQRGRSGHQFGLLARGAAGWSQCDAWRGGRGRGCKECCGFHPQTRRWNPPAALNRRAAALPNPVAPARPSQLMATRRRRPCACRGRRVRPEVSRKPQ